MPQAEASGFEDARKEKREREGEKGEGEDVASEKLDFVQYFLDIRII